MQNLNNSQNHILHNLLLKKKYDLDEAIAIVELYILVRKGRSIKINLEKGTEGYHRIMKKFHMNGQSDQLMRALNDSLQWFGLNYRQDD